MALDDVSKISLSALNTSMLKQKTQDKEEIVKKEEDEKVKAQVDHKDPDSILDAMALSGSQNQAVLGLKLIDPTKYLSPERIKDIQASMGVFEKGVQKNLEVINQEFGEMNGDLSESYKLELAAQMMV